jgi:hypothetical protein
MAITRLTYLLALTLMAGLLLAFAGVASATALDTLKQPPFPPTDVSLFEPDVYSEAPPMVPAAQNPSGENAMRNKLKSLLEKRFGVGSTQVSQGLATYDATSTKAIVPSPRLRATLVSLKGTVGEPAIKGALDGTYGKIYFGTPPCPCDPVEQVFLPSGSTTLEVVFNQKYKYEDFRLLAPDMAHTVLHRDLQGGKKEGAVIASIQSLVYAQFVLESPSLATSGTSLARDANTELMARINSRDVNGKLRLFTSTGNIFPGGNSVPYFAALFEPLGDSANPGSSILKQMVRKVVGSGVTLPQLVNFDDNTLQLLDSNQKVFTNTQLVRLATILKLDTAPQSATAQHVGGGRDRRVAWSPGGRRTLTVE